MCDLSLVAIILARKYDSAHAKNQPGDNTQAQNMSEAAAKRIRKKKGVPEI